MESEPFTVVITKEKLDSLLESGVITREVYDSKLASICETGDRKRKVSELLDSYEYALVRERDDVIEDHRLRLFDDDQFNSFIWYIDNIRGFKHKDEDIITMKIRFSVWGLRIGGRYDTFEYFVDKEDCEMTDRSYCVHGTLFEGCGNYKAPDMARHTPFGEKRMKIIFDYLQDLLEKDILGKDYSETGYDCGFFDLYVRKEDGTSIHTKGTTEYPQFIMYLIQLIGAEDY